MADKSLIEQMLDRLVNGDQAKAEELFHEYVVAQSREIYENLIESEIEEASDEEDEEDKVDEASEDEDAEEDKVDENFEDVAFEAGDETDDLAGELDAGDEMSGEEGEDEFAEKDPAELFQDLDAIVDELQAKFDAMGGEEPAGDDMGDMPEADAEEGFEPEMATVREYVEKVSNGHGAEKKGQGEGQFSGTGSQSDKPNVNTKSTVAGKNDMGGTTANILSSKEEAPKFAGAGGGQLGGSSLFKGTAKEENFGNINVPGGKAGSAFSKKEPGHGAEKKGQPEGKYSGTGSQSDSVNVTKTSLFRGRR